MTEEQKQLIEKDEFVKLILHHGKTTPINIVGGAVIDILEGRKPKDYDLINTATENLKELGFVFSHSSRTADTYIKGDLTVQLLKTIIDDFDFTISTAKITINYAKNIALFVDEKAFNSKTLIPQPKSWTDKKNALNSLKRIPHWKKKGYSIHDVTYLSLLGVVGNSRDLNS